MIGVFWIFVAAMAVMLLTIVFRRVLLRAIDLPHAATLVLAVIVATGVVLAIGFAAVSQDLAKVWAVRAIIAGFIIGVFLTAQEFRNPYHGR